ncbi:MAG TPA: hypothetical protein VGK01_26155 [Candidatus Angelobacter sp.]|jgi:hypothetical protein
MPTVGWGVDYAAAFFFLLIEAPLEPEIGFNARMVFAAQPQ